ncbi:MAG: flagellar biosynthesis regulator FlaF [Hyphomicrobiales bacterium]|nr:flagellar biosynthesis regulator FlaF [Hyphomicrobiales bacterium]
MPQALYREISDDDQTSARRREHDVLDRAVAMLEAARESGSADPVREEALDCVDAIWGAFMTDLSDDANALDAALRAQLISIGLWNFRKTTELRLGAGDLAPLIEVNAIVRDGLR